MLAMCIDIWNRMLRSSYSVVLVDALLQANIARMLRADETVARTLKPFRDRQGISVANNNGRYDYRSYRGEPKSGCI